MKILIDEEVVKQAVALIESGQGTHASVVALRSMLEKTTDVEGDEIDRLRKELSDLESSVAPWRELQAENKRLKAELADLYKLGLAQSHTINKLEAMLFGKREILLDAHAAMVEREDNETPPCKDHPDAPHGFSRGASHSAGRYVCICESWEPEE